MKQIKKNFLEAKNLLEEFISDENNLKSIEKSGIIITKALENGKKIFSCGNGGSMCDAMHFAEELTGRFRENRKSIPAVAISDASHISCVSNDFGYEFIFSRYLESWAENGDILMAISTSGNSKNVIKAAKIAKEKNMKIIALTGKDGGELSKNCDVEIRVSHFGYADRIQEIHIKIIHSIIHFIEKKLKE